MRTQLLNPTIRRRINVLAHSRAGQFEVAERERLTEQAHRRLEAGATVGAVLDWLANGADFHAHPVEAAQ